MAPEKRLSLKGNVEIVEIPAGRFIMGSKDAYGAFPVRDVYLEAFRIGRTSVTVGQFKAYCADVGVDFSKFKEPSWGWIDDHPMVNVSWQQARDFCLWAGGDLATEAQWEKAARGRDGFTYPWGRQWDASRLQWSSDGKYGSAASTAPVESFPSGASPYGCLDMAGNVWDWCLDWYQDCYEDLPTSNPIGPASGTFRVLRGRSWYDCHPDDFRSPSRFYGGPVRRSDRNGFRLVDLHLGVRQLAE